MPQAGGECDVGPVLEVSAMARYYQYYGSLLPILYEQMLILYPSTGMKGAVVERTNE